MFKITIAIVFIWFFNLFNNWQSDPDFGFWRHHIILLTGFLSITYMGVAALLSARLKVVESFVKGLDKGYAQHKQLGIGATLSLILHWASNEAPKWMIELGLMQPPSGKRPEKEESFSWHDFAGDVGEYSFYIFLIFAAISLIHAFSYRRFISVHKIAGLLIFAGIFHTLLLLDWNIASIIMNTTILLISCLALFCAILSLSNKIGHKHKAQGHVIWQQALTGKNDDVLGLHFKVKIEQPIHYLEGQFAYLNFHDKEPPHPFTIVNYDKVSKVLEFAIKNLGDYTKTRVKGLSNEQKVTVEGGYGRFQTPNNLHQVWIGAGIGITPFLARLNAISQQFGEEQGKKITLFYCVNNPSEAFFEQYILNIIDGIESIQLIIIDSSKGERLTAEDVLEQVLSPDASICFCGPDTFAKHLKSKLILSGMPEKNFHQENFKMR